MSFIENFFHPKNNVEEVSSLVCKFLNLRLTNDTLCNHLRNHPFYPSLLAVHDVFEEFGVMSEAYKCNDSDRIVGINVPFLAQIRSKESQGQRVFALIYSNDGNETNWYNPLNHKREHITIGNLKKLLTGYIMLFYPSRNSGDKDFVMHRRKEILREAEEHALISFLPLSLIIIAIYKAFVGTFYLIATLYAILLLAGCIICGLLLMHEYNSYNPIVKSVCGDSRKINCEAVLSSPGSTIAGVPWSIIGSTYFLGSLVSILVSGFDIGVLINLCYINILSLPYTAYSLYYQKRVVRQWCPLCLSILIITWCLFIVSLAGGIFSRSVQFSVTSLMCVVVGMVLASSLTYIVWNYGRLSKKLENTEVSYRTTKYNKDIFDALLKKGKHVDVSTNGYGIILGNPNGHIHIIEACNPYCGHCGRVHSVLSSLINDNDDICLQIMFVMGPNDAGYDQSPIDMLCLYRSQCAKDANILFSIMLKYLFYRVFPALIAIATIPQSVVAKEHVHSIEGMIVDNLTGQGLDSAIVFLMTEDSVVVDSVNTFLIEGSFGQVSYYKLRTNRKGKFVVHIKKNGYWDAYSLCEVKSNRQSQIFNKEIRLIKRMSTQNLPEVTVQATKLKMVLNGDTIIYNADAFNLPEGSMLDALVSRLPGATLTRDGQIFVKGKKVESLLVNGRGFFSGNPEVALQNLPAYIVSKIKVYNRSGMASQITGRDMGDKQIVMDVKLKREYAKNYIGNLEGGIGTKDRYLARGLGMKFSDKEQAVGFFNINNVNNNDHGRIGGNWEAMDVADGLIATKTAGFSYQNYLDGQFKQLTGELFYTHTGIDNWAKSSAQTFLPTGDSYLTNVSKSTNSSDLLKGNFILDTAIKNIGVKNQLDISYTNTKGFGNNISETSDSSSVFNRMLMDNSIESHDFNFNLSSDYSYYILKMDILTWGFNIGYDNFSQRQFSLNDVTFLNDATPRDYRNNYLESPNHNFKLEANLGYEYSLNPATLSLGYYYTYAYNKAENMLYRLDKLSGRDSSRFDMLPSAVDALASVLDKTNSYTFHEYTNEHRVVPSYHNIDHMNGSGLIISLPVRFVNSNLYYERMGRHDVFKNRVFVEPYLSVWKRNYFEWQLNAGMSSSLPDMTSMVEYRDDSDPLNIRLGNSNLKDIHRYDASLSLRRNGERQKSLDATIGYHQTDNAVAYVLNFDKLTGISTTKPVSVNGNWNAGLETGYSLALDSAQLWNFSNRLNVRYNHNVDMAAVSGSSSSMRSIVHNWQAGDNLKLTWRPNDNYELTLHGAGNYFYINCDRSGFSDIHAGNYSAGLNAYVGLPWHFQLSTDMTMFARRGYQQSEMNTTDWVWNAQLTRSFIRGHLIAKLQGFDILHQLSTTSYAVNAQGRTETWHNSIPRYAMLSLSWHFNVNPKKKNNNI